MQLSESQKADYLNKGYILLKRAISQESLNLLETRFLSLVSEWGGRDFNSAQSPELAEFLLHNRDLERRIYDGIRAFSWLEEFSLQPEITNPIKDILGNNIALMSKIPFRIDLPGVTRELAVWHQDYKYVMGNEEIVTAYTTLQDTPYIRGCLMVMPGSHKLGALNHDAEVLGKRHYPSNIFDREVRYVEMERGDLLLFNALLLHSLGLNLSSTAMLTVQSRYSERDAPTHPAMGKLIAIKN